MAEVEGGQRDVAYQAALIYNAGPNLRDTISGFLSEEGRRMVGERALTMISQTMFFDNVNDLRRAKGTQIDPLVRPNAPLSRIDFNFRAGVEMNASSRGEVGRLLFQPGPTAEASLKALGAKSSRLPRNGLSVAHMDVVVPRQFLPGGDPDELADDLSEALREARQTRGALFGSYLRTLEDRIR